MKLLFYLTRYPGIGGIEKVTTTIASELSRVHDIFILSHMKNDEVKGVDCATLLFMPNDHIWNATENFNYFEGLLQVHHFDAIIYQDSYAPTEHMVCVIAKRYSIPLYVFEHNSPLFIYNKRDLSSLFTIKGFLRRILHPYLLYREVNRKRLLLSHCRKYVLLSKQFVPEFCKLVGADINDKRITYIHNPAFITESNSNISKKNVVLCVSRLVQEKQVDKMLIMWKVVAKKLSDWKFLIVGDGPERTKLESIVVKNNISRVEFIGFANPTPYYQEAKLFWMTSKFEGWGMTLIEAMQFSCVPIAFKTFSSIADIIISRKNGMLVEPYNVDEFINCTVDLANKEDIRTQLAEQGARDIHQFSLDKVLVQWQNLLTEV